MLLQKKWCAILLGTNIKVSRGIVSALPPLRGIPDPKLENSMMHDAATLPGSSGGPVLNQAGLILGVHCAAMGEFKFAVTSNDAIAFSRPIVSDILVEAPRDQPSSTWENTVERLRKSTAQVVVLAESDGIDPIDKDFGEIKWDPYDDPWCMACYGRNTLDCPVRGCARGGVRGFSTEVIPGPLAIRVTTTPVRVKCDTCGGRGQVNCDYCDYGFDSRFVSELNRSWLIRYADLLRRLNDEE